MSQFVTLANTLTELGSSILIVAASVWFAFKYLPIQMKQQGEVEEILRNNTAVVENCTEVLRMVSVKDGDTKEVLQRCESRLEEILKRQNEIVMELRVGRKN